MTRGFVLALSLGVRDLLHDRASFVTQVMALVAVLVPLFILYSLWTGVVAALVTQLAEDPRNRQLVLTQQGHFPPSFFADLRADPRVEFAAGHASPIAREVSFSKTGAGVSPRADGVVLGSGPGDPLLGRSPPPGVMEAVVSAALAARLGVRTGDGLLLSVDRGPEGRKEELPLELAIVGVMPSESWNTEGALLAERTLAAVEHWRDGFAVPEFGWSGALETTPFTYRNIRLYARSLPALESLQAELASSGLPVVAPRLREYRDIVELNTALGVIFGVITAAGGAGFLLSFSATLWGNIERKRPELSVLRLHGLLRRHAAAFPVAQAGVVVVAGWMTALSLHSLAMDILGARFANAVSVPMASLLLTGQDALIGFGFMLMVGLLAAVGASWRVTQIDPGEGVHGS